MLMELRKASRPSARSSNGSRRSRRISVTSHRPRKRRQAPEVVRLLLSKSNPTASHTGGSSFAAAAVAPALETNIEEKLEAPAPAVTLSTIDRVKAVLENQRKMLVVAALMHRRQC